MFGGPLHGTSAAASVVRADAQAANTPSHPCRRDSTGADLQMAIDQVAFFDAHIEVYTNDSRVKIQYDT